MGIKFRDNFLTGVGNPGLESPTGQLESDILCVDIDEDSKAIVLLRDTIILMEEFLKCVFGIFWDYRCEINTENTGVKSELYRQP